MEKSESKVKRAVVLTADKFEDIEVYVPIFRLMEAGVQVDVAAPKKEEIHGENGYTLMPDLTIDQVNPNDYDFWTLAVQSPWPTWKTGGSRRCIPTTRTLIA